MHPRGFNHRTYTPPWFLQGRSTSRHQHFFLFNGMLGLPSTSFLEIRQANHHSSNYYFSCPFVLPAGQIGLFFHTSFFFSWHKPNKPTPKNSRKKNKKTGKIYITLANAIFVLENMQAAVSGLMNIPHYIPCVCVDVYTTLKEFIPFPLPSGFNWKADMLYTFPKSCY